MFCPFVKGDCVADCIFYNGKNDCNFLGIITKIRNNTGSDQTESWNINNKLDTISDKIDSIIKKL